MLPEPLWGSESFRRLMGWSAGAHLLALLMMVFGGTPWSQSSAQSVVFIDVIAAAAPEPAPAARLKKQVVDEAVVIPKQPKPAVKKKPPKKVEAKPEPKPEAKPEPAGPSAQELLAQMRERQAASTVVADIRSKHEAQQRGGAVGRVDPRLARYVAEIRSCMYSKLTWRDTSRTANLEVRFALDIAPSGKVLKVKLVEGSGNRYLDESAERAIWKCQPFPPPPNSQFSVIFNPSERF
jgi:colicin import membrane protein